MFGRRIPDVDGPVTWVRDEDAGWHADHVLPLWKVDRTVPEAFWFWTMANLQTLCLKCHAAKTKREAGERAALKRPQASLPFDQPDLSALA
jgi:5-methylcytosine-specific restriction endonuclease McrA